MAGNTRGKLKEHLEGIHRNNEWVKKHISDSLILIGDKNEQLTRGLKSLAEAYNNLDELTLQLYSGV